MRLRESIARFMVGRYGTDQLNRTLLIISIVCILLSNFGFTLVLYTIGLALLIISNLRMFSRNHQARYRENMMFTKQFNKVKGLFRKSDFKASTSKTHRIFSCPQCKQRIRVPRGKGKIMVRCPKCGIEFAKKS